MRHGICRISVSFALTLLVWTASAASPSFAQQSCDSIDECTINAVCQPDGTCKGTARPNGESCDDGNPCTMVDKCQSGRCTGTTPANNGTSCTSVFSALGQCLVSATCTFGQCIPSFKTCPSTDNNNCTFDFCNPSNGQCTVFTNTCQDACSTAQCDPGSGECVNKQPANSGNACDDFNECTSNDRCNAGECVGMGGSSGPTATRTPTVMRTPTPTGTAVTPVAGCVGDCNNNGQVTIQEVVLGILGALEQEDVEPCNLDRDENGEINIDEIVAAVNSLGRICGGGTATPSTTASVPTPTRTTGGSTPTATPIVVPTSTPTSPLGTPTNTPTTAVGTPTSSPTRTATVGGSTATTASRAAGVIQSTSTVLLAVPDLVSFLIGHIPQGAAKRMQIFELPVDCPGGGGAILSCDQDFVIAIPPIISAPVFTVQLNTCKAAASNGATVTLNGSLTLTGADGQICNTVPQGGALEIPSLTVEEVGNAGSVTTTFASFSANLTLGGSDAECNYSTINMDVAGGLTVTTKNSQGAQLSSTQVSFGDGASIAIEVAQYAAGCAPAIYSSTLSGVATFVTAGSSFTASFDPFQVTNDTTSGSNSVTVVGNVTSACLGDGSSLFLTRTNLDIAAGAACPRAGEQVVEHGADLEINDLIRYKTNGLEIDYGDNGSIDATFESCLDPRLSVCVAS